MKILKRISNALKWNAALDLASNGKPRDALAILSKIDRTNLAHLKADIDLFQAYLMMRTGDNNGAKKCVSHALTAIEASDYLTAWNKGYMKKYAEWIIASLLGQSVVSGIDYSSISLSKIDRRTKDIFPLRGHPSWRE